MYDMFEEMFGCNPFSSVDLEYQKYKGKTPYKVYKLKSGKFSLNVGTKHLEIYSAVKDAKKEHNKLAKQWLGL